MLDRTIPFFNVILRCDDYGLIRIDLPEGYRIVPYQPGYEDDWARMECLAGDFASEKEAADYFRGKYTVSDSYDDILFLLEKTGKVIGSCTAWTDERKGSFVNSLHWLIIDKDFQGKKLGRSLCAAVMNRFSVKNGGPVYIHTQPWSWKAILLYSALGFRLQKSDTFGTYVNQYHEAMNVLKQILREDQIRTLEEQAED